MLKRFLNLYLAPRFVIISLSLFVSFSVFAGPKELLYNVPDLLKSCLFWKDGDWALKCPFDQFVSRTRARKESDYGRRYVYARALYNRMLLQRAGMLRKKIKKKAPQYFVPAFNRDSSGFLKFFFPAQSSPRRRVLDSQEVNYLRVSAAYVKEIEFWLTPLMKRSDKLRSYLHHEAIELFFSSLGDALHFEKLKNHLKDHGSVLLSGKSRKRRTFEALVVWTELYGAYPIKEWFRKNLKRYRTRNIRGRDPDELFYWVHSFKVLPLPLEPKEKEFVLKHVRKLWIAYPNNQDRLEIKSLLRSLGLKREFKAPSISQMSPQELFLRVRSQIRNLDGKAALKDIKRFRTRSNQGVYTKDQVWEAFLLHVRILRLLDRREKIPAVIDSYNKVISFMNPKKKTAKSLKRLLKIAGYQWTYGSKEKALEITHLLEKWDYNKIFLPRTLHLRARIYEQSDNLVKTAQSINKALASAKLSQNLRMDLYWRSLFLKFENAKEKSDFAKILIFMNSFKKWAQRNSEPDRWSFWRGRVEYFAGNTNNAVLYFKKLYQRAPFTYYGGLSALALKELGQKVPAWERIFEIQEYQKPSWSRYVDSKGFPRAKNFISMARALAMVRSGQHVLGKEAFYSLSLNLRSYLNHMRHSRTNKFYFTRDVAWLKRALGDPRGALNSAEELRMRYSNRIEGIDLSYLYPMAFWELVDKYSKKRAVDPWVVVSLIRQESAFNPRARSFANALGLMQMIPSTARTEATNLAFKNFKLEQLYEPEVSIRLGTHLLKRLFDTFDRSFICSFAAYNAGDPPVHKWLQFYNNKFPLAFIERISYKETRGYVKKLIRNYIVYQRIYKEGVIDLNEVLKMPGQENTTIRILSHGNQGYQDRSS